MMIAAMLFGLRTITGNEPVLVERKAQPYVSIKETVTMETTGSAFPRLMPKLKAWMKEHKVEANGPEFMRYSYIDMNNGLDIEVGLPIAKAVKGDKEITADSIPAGKYVSLIYMGDYAGLVAPNADLQIWAKQKNLKFKMRKGKKGEEFVSRMEVYFTDPDLEPDKSKWKTEILYMVE